MPNSIGPTHVVAEIRNNPKHNPDDPDRPKDRISEPLELGAPNSGLDLDLGTACGKRCESLVITCRTQCDFDAAQVLT